MAAELGQQSVEFSALVRRAAEESFLALKELVDRCKSADQTDSDRKIELLKFIVKTRQRMLRLHVLAKWCQQVPLVQYCQQLVSTLSSHDTCFTQAADSLFFMHEGLQQARAPIYDVPSAIEVLLTGNYVRLPKCIEDLGVNNKISEKQQKPTLRKLNTIIRSKLLEVTLPKEISEIKICNGILALQVDGEFKVLLTLGYRGHLSLWRILHLELLAGDKSGKVKLEDTRKYILGDDLERRMSAAENPFSILYSILHELSVALVMDTVIRQVQVLRLGRWKDAIRFEFISDGGSVLGGNAGSAQYSQDGEPDSSNLKTPGLKINYWLNSDRGTGGLDSSSSPSLKIEPGSDLRIKCLHSTFVLDPFSDKGAEFDLDQNCIDVEKLLLKAIACNKHTRLLEIQRGLCKSAQNFQNAGDVILHQQPEGTKVDTQKMKGCKYDLEEYLGDEILQVRAYGSVYFTLGISLRTGRFIFQCPKNTIEHSVLAECEEILNQGSMTASEIFIRLRSKSILYLFASIGRFLGLQVYEQGVTKLKIPTSILNGLDLLLMGFPQCGATYYLMIQLDRDFKPLFKLLEIQSDNTGGGPSTLTDGSHIIRLNDIDISHMELIEDEMNLSFISLEKLNLVLPNVVNSFQSSEHALCHSFTMEPSLQNVSCSQSSFSCIVDEVFELERGASAPHVSIQNKSLNSSSHMHINTLSAVKVGLSSFRSEGTFPYRHSSNQATNSCLYNGLLSNGAFASSVPLSGSASSPNLAKSKSDQDLTAVKNAKLAETSIVKDDKISYLDESSRESGCTVSGSSSRIISPSQPQGSMTNFKHGSLKISSTGCDGGSLDTEISSLWKTFPMRKQTLSFTISNSSMQSKIPRKRTMSDILPLISSLEDTTYRVNKRRKTSFSHGDPATPEIDTAVENERTKRLTYLNLLADVNNGVAPNVYISSLLHVVRHCSLCIKHARLTSQMDALKIPYVEDVGLRSPSLNLWFRLPFVRDDFWQSICLHLGKPGTMSWDVKVTDPYFKELWEVQKGSNSTAWGHGICIANTCDIDSHIHYDPEGITLSYRTVEHDSIRKLVSDLQRLFNARLFAFGMRKLLIGPDETKDVDTSNSDTKTKILANGSGATCDKTSEQIGKVFKIEAVGLMSLWFCYGPMHVIAHFVVEWESGKEGCTMHVSPDQLWPHTKFLEDFINGGDVASFLDCVRLTAGPLLSLGGAIRPAKVPPPVASVLSPLIKQNSLIQSLGIPPNALSSNAIQPPSSGPVVNSATGSLGNHSLHSAAMLSAATRGGPGIVPSSLLPIDVSVVMRGPYWIRIIYRKQFSVDMRCYAGDQVWLQPATPPKGGPAAGGSLPCPYFRPFIMEHVAQGLNALETNIAGNLLPGGLLSSGNTSSSTTVQVPNGNKSNVTTNVGTSRPSSIAASQGVGGLSRVGNAVLAPASLATAASGLPSRISSGTGVPVHVKGELNTAFIGLGDDGGYGGGWVPLAALKKVLRGILKYLGVLWLFAQLPDLLKDIFGSVLTNNEGALLTLDQEQPALRFFVRGYVFAVSVHRVQLLLQVLSVKRFHNQQQQQQQTQSNTQEDLASTEISEICDYFSRRVASEPYDASRVASFITLLTLPISILREFLKLTAWEKAVSHAQGGDIAPAQRARVELCLENHSIAKSNISHNRAQIEKVEKLHVAKSNIHHDRAHNAVEFSLTFVLDSALIPHVNAAGGAAWLPYCVSVRLKYSFGENAHISLIAIDGSHGGKACWSRLEDWDKCKQRLTRAVDFGSGNSASDFSQGRLRLVAENLQRTLQASLQQLKDAYVSSTSATT